MATDLGSELRSLRRARPFKPFALQTKSNGEIHVYAATRFGTSGDRICVFPPGGGVRLMHFTDVSAIRPLTDEEMRAHKMPAYLRHKPKRPDGEA